MIRRPPRSTRTDPLLPYTTLFRSCELARRRVPPGLIVGILTDKTWGISAHVLDQKRPGDYAWRQVEKAYQAAEVEGEPFQTDKDGKPYANQHNIRLALSKMGVTVRHDKFAVRMLVEGVYGWIGRQSCREEVCQ